MKALKEKILKPIVVILMILVLTVSDFILFGLQIISYAIETIEETNSNNILFSAYFLDENGQSQQYLEKSINKEAKLILEAEVKNTGYFDGAIELTNSNFKIKNYQNDSSINSVNGNIIKLNQINAGSHIKLEITVESLKDDMFDLKNLNMVTDIKITGTYVNDSKSNKSIDSSRQVQIKWNTPYKNTEDLELNSEVVTNSVYEVNGTNKRIVQVNVKSGLINNAFPIKSTKIYTNVFDNVEDIYVQSRGTYATNNDNGLDFNWDKTNNQFVVDIVNQEKDGYVYWNKVNKDDIIITFVFPEGVTVDGKKLSVNSQVELYDGNTQLTKNVDVENIQEKDGAIDYKIERDQEIYKGNLYYGEDTQINSRSIIDVRVKGISEKITIQEGDFKYNDNNAANVYYTKTVAKKSELLKILGESGSLNVKTLNGDIISSIDSNDLNNNENEFIDLEYEKQNNIVFEFLNITEEGKIELNNTCILEEHSYNKNQIKKFDKLQSRGKLIADKNVENISKEVQSDLKEPETVAKFVSNRNVLSTLQKNENVEFNIILKTDDVRCNLYKNPIIEIEFPSQVTGLEAQLNPVYVDDFDIESGIITETENGNKLIRLQLKGEQHKHSNNVSEGIVININSNIDLIKYIGDINSEITMRYTNENDESEVKEIKLPIEIKARSGLIVYNKVENFNNNGDVLETLEEKGLSGNLDIDSSEKILNGNIVITNNYDQKMENINVLGKITEESNVDLKILKIENIVGESNIVYSENGLDWVENIEQLINPKYYKIEIGNLEKGQNIAVKYNIYIPSGLKNDAVAKIEQKITGSYIGQEISKESALNFATSSLDTKKITNSMLTSTMKLEGKTALTESTNQQLNVNVKTYLGDKELGEQENVYEGETLRNIITITNTTGQDLDNLKVKVTQENANIYDLKEIVVVNPIVAEGEFIEHEYDELDTNIKNFDTIDKLKAGESVKLQYEVVVKEIEGNDKTTYGNIEINSEELTGIIGKTIENKIGQAEIKINSKFTYKEELKIYSGEEIKTQITTKNISDHDLENVKVKVKLSDEMYIKDNDFSKFFDEEMFFLENNRISDLKYESSSNTISYVIDNLKKGQSVIGIFNSYAKELGTNEDENLAIVSSEATTETSNKYLSNVAYKKIYQDKKDIKINQTTDVEDGKVLKEGDNFNITIKVSNNSKEDTNVKIIDTIEQAFKINTAILVKENETKDIISSIDSGNVLSYEEKLDAGKSFEVKLGITLKTAFMMNLGENIVKNTVKLEYDNFTLESNELSFKVFSQILPEEGDKPGEDKPGEDKPGEDKPGEDKPGEDNSGEDEEKTYKISGCAWLDNNKNGIKEANEEKFSNIKVKLLNNKTGKFITNSAGEEIVEITDENGQYQFNVVAGEYIVVFLYDTSNYSLTQYKTEAASESTNSDFIKKSIMVNSEDVEAAITDNIKVENSDFYNIDIGLIKNQIFDLKLDKYISKIMVQNTQGTKEYKYDKEQLAKIEIKAKSFTGTTVVVEYNIVVTNEGEIDGYANDIVDYIPVGYKFSSELNKDWYINSDGELHNVSLEDEKISFGESKTLKLILTKTLTANDAGLTVNTAEIYKSSNDQNINDKDSVAGNKQDKEDDISNASVIISIGTGKFTICVIGILITLIVIAILIYVYFWKRKEVDNIDKNER